MPGADDGGVMAKLVELLRAGEHVVVSCRFGLGRSPMVAAALLTDLGLSPDTAEDRVVESGSRRSDGRGAAQMGARPLHRSFVAR